MKIIAKLEKCMSKNNNIIKAGFCALVALFLILVVLRLVSIVVQGLYIQKKDILGQVSYYYYI